MKISAANVSAASDALGAVLRFTYPADAVLSRYFGDHRELGQHDRAFVAESVFGVLRHARTLEHLAATKEPRRLVIAWLARFSGVSVREIAHALDEADSAWAAELKSHSMERLPPAVRAELPDWVYGRLLPDLGESTVLELGRALQQPAPLDLRVNTLRGERTAALAALAQSGVRAAPTPYSPVGLRVAGKPAINRHPLFLDGTLEVQDEGSQLVALLLAPRRRELVVDFCAGAGGKSLMLGAMMQNQGRVYAFDVSPARLAKLKPRLKRSGLSNLHPHLLANEHDQKVKRLAGKIDRVLVDAPCSGLGTLRRNPDLKWRQSPDSVAEMRLKQRSILDAASTLVKPTGRLVYATCSLLSEENEEIVDGFLRDHEEFESVDCGRLLAEQKIAIAAEQNLRLWPHVHHTDGFFAAVLERKAR